MALSDIKNSILAEAQAEVEKIDGQYAAKLQERQAEWKDKASKRQAKLIAGAKRKAEQKFQQAAFTVQAHGQSAILATKRKQIDSVFSKAVEALASLDDDKQIDLLANLLKQLPHKNGKLKVAKDSESLVKKAIKEAQTDHQILNENVTSRGGFVFRHGPLEINNTYEKLVEDLHDELTPVVAETLFGESN